MSESAFIGIASFWMAAVGGAVGSFLNVVVYRLPAGMSLSYPGSHCPQCRHPIRWHDNVPVFGWIVLAGRCRDCRTWIPLRYPLVEAVTAALFVLIALTEGATLGENLPVRPVPVVDGFIFPELTLWQLAGIMGWHLLLLCTLLCAALIRYDGHQVPPRLFLPGMIVAALGSLVWPHLHPQPAAAVATGPVPGLVDALAGFSAGTVLGLIGWRLLERDRKPDLIWSSALAGAMLGWQAAIVAGGTTILLALASKIAGRLHAPWRRVPPVAWLGLGSLVWIVHWHWLAEMLFGS